MSEERCGRCRRPLPATSSACAYCQSGKARWRREATVIVSLVALGAVLFCFTWLLTHKYDKHRRDLAVYWYDTGQQALAASEPREAISDLRSALFYRDDNLYRLRLAEALAAANYTDQAKAYLLNLWEERPGSGNINLELARISAEQKNMPEAVRYYHGAIYGVWDGDALQHRLAVRLELIRYLLQQNQTALAYAETTSLAASIPADNARLHTETGELFAQTGDSGSALAQFQLALKLDPHSASALAGAANAAFSSGEYRRAKQYLEAALHEEPDNPLLAKLLEQADLVLASDPLDRHQPRERRDQRAIVAFEQAGIRLRQCGAPVALATSAEAQKSASDNAGVITQPANRPDSDLVALAAEWNNLRPKLNARALSLNSDLLENAADLVFRIEHATAKTCGTPTGLDWALLQLANHGSEAER